MLWASFYSVERIQQSINNSVIYFNPYRRKYKQNTFISLVSDFPRSRNPFIISSVTGKFIGSTSHRLIGFGLQPLRNCHPNTASSIHRSRSDIFGTPLGKRTRIFLRSSKLYQLPFEFNRDERPKIFAAWLLRRSNRSLTSSRSFSCSGILSCKEASKKPGRSSFSGRAPHPYRSWLCCNSMILRDRITSGWSSTGVEATKKN